MGTDQPPLSRPSPARLWQQAADEHPTDIVKRRDRYRELMRHYGHVVPGKFRPLPCGWPRASR